jgi:hypothetical protein
MPRRTHKQAWLDLVVGALVVSLPGGCDGAQTVSLVAEDFRFVPDVVRVRSSSPLTLSVYNAGREIHEFDSPILLYATEIPVAQTTAGSSDSPGLLLPPGRSLQILMAPPPGTYLYICRRKGHANMTGMLVVE